MIKQHHFIFLFIIFIASISKAQTLTFENVIGFDKNDTGTLISDDGSKSHYLRYGKYTDEKHNVLKQFISFFDENLTLNHTEENISSSENSLYTLFNNKSHLMATFYDRKASIIRFKVLNSEGKIFNSYEYHFDKRFFSPFLNYLNKLVYPIDNKGFLVNQIVKKRRLGYNITFVSSVDNSNWNYESPADHDNRKDANILLANNRVVVLSEREWGSNFDHMPTFNIIVLDAQTGKVIFTKSLDYEVTPNYYSHAFMTDQDDILLFGEVYDKDNRLTNNDYNKGYFIEKLRLTGEQTKSSTFSFDDDRFRNFIKFEKGLRQDDFGTIYFSSIKEHRGDYYFVGQIAKRSKQGYTVFKQIVSTSVGGAVGGAIENNWQSTYELKDIVVMKVDSNLNLVDCTLLPKTVTHTGLNTLTVRPQFNIMEMDFFGRLDFINHTVNIDEQVITYKDLETTKNTNKLLLKRAVLKDGSFTFLNNQEFLFDKSDSDFTLLTNEKTETLLLKYNRELKKIQVVKNKID